MAYTRTNWKSGAEGGTLVTDERLNNIEDGIELALQSVPSPSNGALMGTPGKKYKLVAGVIRNDGAASYWQPLNDVGHRPINVGAVTTSTTGITIDYTAIGAVRVGSFVVGCDETFASAGFVAGASVGLTAATIELTKTTPFADYVSYNGTAWVSLNNVFTLAYGIDKDGNSAPGNLRATHPLLPAGLNIWDINVVGRGATVPNSNGGAETQMHVQFRDWAGTLLTVPTTDMKAFISHGATGRLDPQRVDTTQYPGSNLWFFGVFEVA
jgi:hypothetical protein